MEPILGGQCGRGFKLTTCQSYAILFVPYAFVACPGTVLLWTLSPCGLFTQIIIALLVLWLVVVLCDLFTHIWFSHEEELRNLDKQGPSRMYLSRSYNGCCMQASKIFEYEWTMT